MYELGATYLKLRAALSLDQVLPEIDPAVYNIRFANRLDFGNKATMVAREASRLVKRFKADWMTAGRRPAGICGACLVIASRMNDFLRTPEEVAQVVKVSPQTIKKRLQEFALTAMASKSVAEWRAMTDAELEAVNKDELPPVVKEQRARDERKRRRGTACEENDSKPNTRASSRASSRAATATPSSTPARRRPRLASKGSEAVESNDDAAADVALAKVTLDIGDEDEEGEDTNLEELAKEDYVGDIQRAGDDSELARDERRRERRRLFRGVKTVAGGDDDEELDELAADADEYDNLADAKEDAKEEGGAAAVATGGFKDLPPSPTWNDKEAVYAYIETNIFGDEGDLLYVTTGEKAARIERWLRGREPRDVIAEMRRVQWAHHKREYEAKQSVNETLSDIDDDELENIYVMEEGEQAARARMWLSHNARWLEEDKERQIKKAKRAEEAEQKRAGRPPRKGAKRQKRTQPFASAREAIDNFASTKKFSSRINMDAIRRLDAGEEYDLQSMPDEDDKDDKADDKADDADDDEDFVFDIPPGQFIDHKGDSSDEE